MTTPLLDHAVRMHGLQKSFGAVRVLHGVDLTVERGQAAFIIGPSGSGKSTLLRCVNSLESYDGGELWVDGYLVGAERRGDRWIEASATLTASRRARIGMVFQRFNLFPNMTALENVTAGLRMVLKQESKQAFERGRELLARVGLANRADSYPSQLSGGQQQRVAIARAIAANPSIVLFDEPTSALDPELVGEVLAVMRDLARDGMTMLIVTHEISFAEEVGDVVHFIDGGKVAESGSPSAVIRHSNNPRTAEFLARIRKPG
ncbi:MULTISPECIES: amino acid ABC transporter ATP-binding protein [unclassified Mesorhizobium]|uniref:amino acid ABC transporter ATP-binding protein n=1 Tax=unclassified Mesorhizobium TaxID=325217 RepID=UPI00086F31A5|nr:MULTISPECIES: amino acid ABC transporter ATP-binding protein [unclassified Mesorhizobium]MBN9253381.1 amino acid ABC transporter ATP-binding protein [Mesorhizobium sp.]MBN9271947.1 amino acid ABC transporter ATP-binding protein [Mesorhizobium sp.]ODT20696.1 MAG: ectoine/hydroxyectoine ABC transporter ATP-binding protein EhuA [Mesorhizobium sp. SCN 65-12]OJX82824.1 MAG: ectoine/hydroxyectoine ABC transporter ATP-binding protein EhuA [Mesorhizobium sp. 65-26]